MRRFLPDSLAAWALMILIGVLIVAEVSTLAAILQSRAASARMTGFFHLAQRVSSIARAIAAETPGQRQPLAAALSESTLSVRVDPLPLGHADPGNDDGLAELEDVLQGRLADAGVTDVRVELRPHEIIPDRNQVVGPSAGAGPIEQTLSKIAQRYAGNDAYIASMKLADGSWLNFIAAIAPSPNLWSMNALALVAFAIAAVLAASIWALRQLTAPYALLAAAAERFGLDHNTSPLPERGPSEIRTAVRAFNLMQERLKRVIDDRNQLAAAISHDLRTPATRLRLRAEFISDPRQRAHMLADLTEIETMTRSVLAFASDSAQPEVREPLDLVSLLQSLCDDTTGATLALPPDLPPRIAYPAQPVALRRCLANLLDNAVRYGERALVTLTLDKAAVHIRVDDDGPGIPASSVEEVFRPFRRLEASRNRETGGTGLGLTIARSVARAHGGDIVLANRPAGGLTAELVLPLVAPARFNRAA